MRPERLKFNRLAIIFLAAGLLIFLVLFIYSSIDLGSKYQFVNDVRASVFSKLSFFGSFLNELKRIKNLTNDNLALKEENKKLLSEIAASLDVKDENRFLREALNLESVSEYNITQAKTFNVNLTPEGHSMLVNEGSSSDIAKDDAVISSSGALIGKVTEVSEHFSRIQLITDPDFKATVKLLNKETLGISAGLLNDGIILDFISQNDEVAENDTAVTYGNDLIPPGLIIGNIVKITSDDGNLFKKVIIKPEFNNIDISRVLILSQ